MKTIKTFRSRIGSMKRKVRKYVIIGILIMVAGILSFFVYQSYAYFKVNYTRNIINATVGSFAPCANCGVLKVSEVTPADTSKFLNSPSPILRNNIETIKFADHKTIPVTALGSWDVSEAGDNSVIAWYENIDADARYEVTIGSVGGVKANVNSNWLFEDFLYLETMDLTNFYTHEATSMDGMFTTTGRYGGVFTLDLGDNFDTSNVTTMVSMFYNTGYNRSAFALDLGDKFDTSKVTNMSTMFRDTGCFCPAFTLDLGDNFDTSNVTYMGGMFFGIGQTDKTFTLDLGNKFDTSKVIAMSNIFYKIGISNPNFTLDLRNFNVSGVKDAGSETLKTFITSHKIYASSSNISFMYGKGFTGTIINCTTNPASCP